MNRVRYRMMEDPAIRVAHLGNPAILNLLTFMCILFGISLVTGFTAVIVDMFIDARFIWLVSVVPVMPLMTAVYRTAWYDKFRYIPVQALHWSIFYVAGEAGKTGYLYRR